MYSILGRLEDFFVFFFFLDIISYFENYWRNSKRELIKYKYEQFSVCQTIIITPQRIKKCILMNFFLSFLDPALLVILRDDKNYSLQIVSN